MRAARGHHSAARSDVVAGCCGALAHSGGARRPARPDMPPGDGGHGPRRAIRTLTEGRRRGCERRNPTSVAAAVRCSAANPVSAGRRACTRRGVCTPHTTRSTFGVMRSSWYRCRNTTDGLAEGVAAGALTGVPLCVGTAQRCGGDRCAGNVSGTFSVRSCWLRQELPGGAPGLTGMGWRGPLCATGRSPTAGWRGKHGCVGSGSGRDAARRGRLWPGPAALRSGPQAGQSPPGTAARRIQCCRVAHPRNARAAGSTPYGSTTPGSKPPPLMTCWRPFRMGTTRAIV